MGEIIRRRLFEWHGMPEDGRKTAAAYAEWAVEHAQELSGIDADTAHATFAGGLPVSSRGPVGLRAEMAESAAIPAHARRAAPAGTVGRPQLPGRTSQGDRASR